MNTLISADVLLAACGGDEETLQELIAGLRAQLPKETVATRTALNGRDRDKLRAQAHKLVGMISAFSTTAANEASALEEQAERGQDESVTRATMGRLERLLEQLQRDVMALTVAELEARIPPSG